MPEVMKEDECSLALEGVVKVVGVSLFARELDAVLHRKVVVDSWNVKKPLGEDYQISVMSEEKLKSLVQDSDL